MNLHSKMGDKRKRVSPLEKRTLKTRIPIVGVGASAGGLEAFRALLKALAPKTGMAYVLVQHLDPNHESMLAVLLARSTQIPVIEVKNARSSNPTTSTSFLPASISRSMAKC